AFRDTPLLRQASSALLGLPSPETRSSATSIAFRSNFPQSGSGCGRRPAATQARQVATGIPTFSAASFSSPTPAISRRLVVVLALRDRCRLRLGLGGLLQRGFESAQAFRQWHHNTVDDLFPREVEEHSGVVGFPVRLNESDFRKLAEIFERDDEPNIVDVIIRFDLARLLDRRARLLDHLTQRFDRELGAWLAVPICFEERDNVRRIEADTLQAKCQQPARRPFKIIADTGTLSRRGEAEPPQMLNSAT